MKKMKRFGLWGHSLVLLILTAFAVYAAEEASWGMVKGLWDGMEDNGGLPLPAAKLTISATPAGGMTSRSNPLLDFAHLQRVGSSKLVRHAQGIKMTIHALKLTPGYTYTIWWVVFNEPEKCTAPGCGEDDVFGDPATPVTDVLFATGEIADESGRASFVASRNKGDASGSIRAALGLDPIGLLDVEKAEVHLVVRSHGPEIPAQVEAQIGSFEGGCTTFMDPPEVPDEEGECADIQFSIYPPLP